MLIEANPRTNGPPVLLRQVYSNAVPVIGVLVVHPHEMFLEAIDLRFATDDPVIVNNGTVGTIVVCREHSVAFLEIVHTTLIPAQRTPPGLQNDGIERALTYK